MNFWDTSGLLPIFVEEKTSKTLRSLFEDRTEEGIVIWTLTPVEFLSSICRLDRMRQMTGEQARAVISRFNEIRDTFNVVRDVETVKDQAERLLRIHSLKAADALQLAAALVSCDNNPRTCSFVSVDDKLAEAAFKEGFQILPST